MANKNIPLTESLMTLGEPGEPLRVGLSHELVELLSSQLYQSPAKAIEELVVNAYDAEAKECRVYIPQDTSDPQFVIVLDNGSGMDREGLTDLWHIGRSKKRSEEVELRSHRKQIGKFGIGKLATHAIARQVTYLTRQSDEIFSVTVNFSDFRPDPEGGGPALSLPIRTIKDPNELGKASLLAQACDAIAVSSKTLIESRADWTMVILEDLKEKVFDLRAGWLRWLLGTAMPLKPDFRLFANGTEVVSSKEDYAIVSEFDVTDLTESRFKNIEKLAAWPGAPTMESLHRVSFPKV